MSGALIRKDVREVPLAGKNARKAAHAIRKELQVRKGTQRHAEQANECAPGTKKRNCD